MAPDHLSKPYGVGFLKPVFETLGPRVSNCCFRLVDCHAVTIRDLSRQATPTELQ